MYIRPRTVIKIVICVLLLIGGTAGLWIYRSSTVGKQFGQDLAAKSGSQIVDRLKTLSELHTALGVVQTIVTSSQDSKILGMQVGATKLIYVASGQIRAGIDLRKLTPSSITVENNRLHLLLPAPEILDTKLDVENSYVYDVSKSLVAPDGLKLQSEAQKKAMEAIKSTALKCGVLEAAAEQAKSVLTAILNMGGFNSVDVIVAPSAFQLQTEEIASPKP